ncbi:MAG: hypothetical protein GC149_20455 [Gammaproteobacteria bacterium]|nr:hypothetical protein [Gammaproteobacteria bacterium]
MKTNVLMFPNRHRGLAGPGAGTDELVWDYLAMANYIVATASLTANPGWCCFLAGQLRSVAMKAAERHDSPPS